MSRTGGTSRPCSGAGRGLAGGVPALSKGKAPGTGADKGTGPEPKPQAPSWPMKMEFSRSIWGLRLAEDELFVAQTVVKRKANPRVLGLTWPAADQPKTTQLPVDLPFLEPSSSDALFALSHDGDRIAALVSGQNVRILARKGGGANLPTAIVGRLHRPGLFPRWAHAVNHLRHRGETPGRQQHHAFADASGRGRNPHLPRLSSRRRGTRRRPS